MPITSTRGKAQSITYPVTSLSTPAMVVNAGQSLIVGVSINGTTESVSSVTDTAGNTFIFCNAVNNDGYVRAEIWQAQNIAGNAADAVTVHLTGLAVVSIIAWEYAGVNVETMPSPQDLGSTTGFSTQVTCGVGASAISSWAVTIFAYVATPFIFFCCAQRGILRIAAPDAFIDGGVQIGIGLVDVQAYAAPSSPPAPDFLIATPLGQLTAVADWTLQDPVQWCAVSLELRSTGGPTGHGGSTPSNPPWTPAPAGDLVGWSYTFTIGTSPDAPAITADVTCSYMGGGCTNPNEEFGNPSY